MPEPRLEVNDTLGRRIVTIEKVPFLIGRRVGSDLHLPSAEVSRDHAEIVSAGDAYAINDRGSRYGTFVNDQEVTEQALTHGDRIRLGRSGGAEIVFLGPGRRPADRARHRCGRGNTSAGGLARIITGREFGSGAG